MLKLAAYGALAMAGGLLGLQILGAIEYTEGGSMYARASVIAAMVTLAALPVFIEAARAIRSWALIAALLISFAALLAYSLPATVGKTGEVKVGKVADAAAVARTRDDLERVSKTLEWARKDMLEDCASGEGKRCRAKRNTVAALEDRSEKLSANLAAGEKAAPGDLGAEAWAWASGGWLTAEQVRKGSVVAFALGLDVAIWALIWLATRILTTPKTDEDTVSGTVAKVSRAETESRRAESLDDHEIDALRRAFYAADGPLSNQELADRMGVTKSEASKRVTKAIDLGFLRRDRVGKQVAIAWKH